MEPGRTIGERFTIESVAGQGGTATVYRARDRDRDGGIVALKIGHPGTPAETERFVVEARVLAELQHANIVRYVAHGVMPSGEWYLALEWLDGEDLAQRLKRRPMSVRETIDVIERAADALGHAHRRGVIHRDVKPSNLFLVAQRTDDIRLLDFGVARRDSMQAITRTGLMLGTLGYMSAEGVRGTRLDARADVFALGCVLFKCITGTNAFAGESALSVLAKILLEVPPRLAELAPVPSWLDELCARMLAKDRDARPDDGAAVAAELRLHAKDVVDLDTRPPASVSAPGITAGEQRLVSVALVRIAHAEPDAIDRVAERVQALGGHLEPMGGSAIISIQGGAATDLAARAARCALLVRRAFGTAPIALATGRAVVSARTPFGDVIERAARILELPVEASSEMRAIRIDDVTAGLLDASFVVVHDARGATLRGEIAPSDQSRTLLGKPTPCVGRERELANLVAMYDECVAESSAQVVLITAPAGGGKSRLRHELGRRLSSHSALPRIWIARGDPMSAGSSLAMIAQLVRRQLGVQVGENVESARAKLEAGAPTHPVAEFLGELVGVPFPDEDSIALRSARRDAIVMGDLMRRSWEELVRTELARGPILLVLDDLHWGDTGSVSYIDGILRLCRDEPLMVLALARPDVNDLLGDLWRPRGLQRIELRALPKAAAENLVKDALGAQTKTEIVDRIVAQAAGNPFFLEELVRAESEGLGGAPATVMAMVQGRLEALDPEARRVLRAASVLGEVFWEGAVRSLLGGRKSTSIVEEQLDELGNKEIVVEVSSSRFPGEKEYAFRHSLVREVAYGMLTDADRMLAHQLAGAWLEEAGSTDAVVVAEHFERGSEPDRAASLWRRAAEAALEANDHRLAIARAERGATHARGELLAELRLVQTEAHYWLGQSRETAQRAAEAMAAAMPSSRVWYRAAGSAIVAHARLAEFERVESLVEMLDQAPVGDSLSERIVAIARALTHLVFSHRMKHVPRLIAQLEANAGPETGAWIPWVHAVRALADHDNEKAALAVADAADAFERAGDIRSACLARVNLGVAYNELGLFVEARRVLRATAADAERMGLAATHADAVHNLGWSVFNLGAHDEALELQERAMAAYVEAGSLRMQAVAAIYLAIIHDRLGALDRAEKAARDALARCGDLPTWRAYALATLAHIRLRAQPGEALDLANEAMEIVRKLDVLEEGDAWVRIVHIEALEKNGVRSDDALREAARRLSDRAAKIQKPAWREAFLAREDSSWITERSEAAGNPS